MNAPWVPSINELLDAYRTTGYQPARGVFSDEAAGTACPLVAVAVARHGLVSPHSLPGWMNDPIAAIAAALGTYDDAVIEFIADFDSGSV